MLKTLIFQKVLGSNIRHFLTFAGGVMVSRGYIDAATAETVVGAATTLAGVALSIAEKRVQWRF